MMDEHATGMSSLTRTQRYGIAVLGVALTAVLRWALDPLLGEEIPLLFFCFPVVLACWLGGLGPGLLATLLSLLLGDYLFLSPRGSIFVYPTKLSLTRFGAFAFVGVMFSILFDRIRKEIKARLECLERFGFLVESVRDYSIFTLDPRGRVSCWNAGAERIEGYREREIVGRDFSVLYTPDQVESGKHRNELEIAEAQGLYREEG